MGRNRTVYSLLVYALLIDALAVFAMQSARWRGAWVFVALYWAILSIKNAIDWGRHVEREACADHKRASRRVPSAPRPVKRGGRYVFAESETEKQVENDGKTEGLT